MAMLAAIPLIYSAVKTLADSQNSQSNDSAMRQAGAAKLAAMHQGAQDLSQYRKDLTPQMLQAMQNQLGAYRPAQSVLSQMYGGGQPSQGPPPGPPGGAAPMGAGPGSYMPQGRSLLQSMAQQPSATQRGPGPSSFRMGFGGEMPMPMDLSRRRMP